jgi:hypothetical protein
MLWPNAVLLIGTIKLIILSIIMLNVMAPLKPLQKSQTNVTIAKGCKNYMKLQRGLHKNCKKM